MSKQETPEAGNDKVVGEKVHRNDIYGDIENKDADAAPPAIPAATVVLLREGADNDSVEVLMLQKNKNISFGGMWVFPGGKIDAEDYGDDGELQGAALTAASRETEEETGIKAASHEFIYFAHWTPPPGTPKRFTTWFFITDVKHDEVVEVDGGEILKHRWVSPEEALVHHGEGKIDLAPPTWITLYQLTLHGGLNNTLEFFRNSDSKIYETRVAKSSEGQRVAMWHGDAGYESWDSDVSGERHRLVMSEGGFNFENTVEVY